MLCTATLIRPQCLCCLVFRGLLIATLFSSGAPHLPLLPPPPPPLCNHIFCQGRVLRRGRVRQGAHHQQRGVPEGHLHRDGSARRGQLRHRGPRARVLQWRSGPRAEEPLARGRGVLRGLQQGRVGRGQPHSLFGRLLPARVPRGGLRAGVPGVGQQQSPGACEQGPHGQVGPGAGGREVYVYRAC
jgi:hypothetical protein